MFGHAPKTVSYAWELTSVYMCYSQWGGFNTSLSRLFYLILYMQSVVNYLQTVCALVSVIFVLLFPVRWCGHVPPRATLIKIVCIHYLHHQG